MADNSPHDNHRARKSAKSIREKRAERRSKDQPAQSPMTRLTGAARRHG